MEKFNMPLLGDDFPEIKVNTTQGEMTIPKDFQGKWAVLFSHPADFTPVCTTEFYSFQKRFEEFEKLNCQLVGLSVDQIFSHIKWIEWINETLETDIKFPVIAANDYIANKLGMLHPGKGSNTVRAVFIIDPGGKTRLIIYYPQEIGRNMDEILRALKALQVSDKQGGATPANWPDNELIGERLIVPPAKDIETAEKRKKKYECYDWWFCHKPYVK